MHVEVLHLRAELDGRHLEDVGGRDARILRDVEQVALEERVLLICVGGVLVGEYRDCGSVVGLGVEDLVSKEVRKEVVAAAWDLGVEEVHLNRELSLTFNPAQHDLQDQNNFLSR